MFYGVWVSRYLAPPVLKRRYIYNGVCGTLYGFHRYMAPPVLKRRYLRIKDKGQFHHSHSFLPTISGEMFWPPRPL